MWIIRLLNHYQNDPGLSQLFEDTLNLCNEDAMAKELLNEKSPDISTHENGVVEGWTPLCFAARKGLHYVVEKLVAIENVDVNVTDQVTRPLQSNCSTFVLELARFFFSFRKELLHCGTQLEMGI